MTTYVLLIWFWHGSSSAPSIPIRVDEYKTEAACKEAGAAWNKMKGGIWDRTSKEFTCLPGGRWTGVR